MMICQFARAAIAMYCRLGGLINRSSFSQFQRLEVQDKSGSRVGFF